MLELIYVFLKKLFIEEHEVTKEENGTQLDLKEEYEELKKYFGTLNIIGQMEMKKKVWELTHPSATFMCPPLMKYKSKKGNKKIKKDEQSEVHRDPSQWMYVEGL